MAEPSKEPIPLTERPKEQAEGAEGGEGEKGPSKAALKKAAKEKEKVSIACMTVSTRTLD